MQIKDLPIWIRDLFIEEANKQGYHKSAKNPETKVGIIFWNKTPQGHGFWEAVNSSKSVADMKINGVIRKEFYKLNLIIASKYPFPWSIPLYPYSQDEESHEYSRELGRKFAEKMIKKDVKFSIDFFKQGYLEKFDQMMLEELKEKEKEELEKNIR